MTRKKTPAAPTARVKTASSPNPRLKAAQAKPPTPAARAVPKAKAQPPAPAAPPAAPPAAAAAPPASVTGKLGILVDLLRRPEGVSVYEMSEATGWQIHSVRGALAGALKRQRGFTIISEKAEGGDRMYRIPAEPAPTVARSGRGRR